MARKSWVVAFDLSLAAPAAAAALQGWRPGDWAAVRTWHLRRPQQDDVPDDLPRLFDRYHAIATWALAIRDALGVRSRVHGFVENYGFDQNSKHASRLMESSGIVKYLLYRRGLILQPVSANTARALLGAFPRAKPKPIVRAKLVNVCHAPAQWTQDEIDAFVVLNWGLAQLGGTPLTLVGDDAPRARRASANSG